MFDDGVPAVLDLGLQHLERAGGEHRVVTPHVEQLALIGVLGLEAFDPAHDQATGGLQPPRSGRERDIRDFGELCVGDQFAGVLVQECVRVVDRRPLVVADGGDRGVRRGVGPGAPRPADLAI
jgi:hypothetical protein